MVYTGEETLEQLGQRVGQVRLRREQLRNDYLAARERMRLAKERLDKYDAEVFSPLARKLRPEG